MSSSETIEKLQFAIDSNFGKKQYYTSSPDLEINSTCWDYKNNAKGGK